MGVIKPIEGKTFGRLTVIKYLYTTEGSRKRVYLCRCACGKLTEVRSCHLHSGHTTSCGCIMHIKPYTNTVYEVDGIGICITKSGYFWFDLCDLDLVFAHGWTQSKDQYAEARVNGRNIFFHRVIMGRKEGYQVDHINGDVHDNRRCNLRHVTFYENMMNQYGSGVCFAKKVNKFQSSIHHNGKQLFLGYFDTREEAADAYASAKARLRGAFARTYEKGYRFYPGRSES